MIQTIKNPNLAKGTFVTWGELKKLVGVYRGNWGGYVVSFKVDGQEYSLGMDVGIRTPFSPCTVTITEDGITVEQ